MTYEQATEKIFSLHQFGIKLGLENIQTFLQLIGNPEKKLKTIHIAGSNGKGSTLSFISSILMEHGYKVGFYTSPHLVDYSERIRINGNNISKDFVTNFVKKFNNFIDEHQITFFEIGTAMAFQYFYENNVDFAVIETGLGGRLDATNVINSKYVVITTISLEHTDILGNSTEEIAIEKAGIIHDNSNVFIGYLSDKAKKVIKEKSKLSNSKLYQIEDYVTQFPEHVRIRINNNVLNIYKTELLGNYQLRNVSLAVFAIKIVLDKKLRINKILDGIANASKNSKLRGRFEIYSNNPIVIFDSAHNIEGIEMFLDSFKKMNYSCKKKVVIFGCMKDKAILKILEKLNEIFDEFYFTSINYERALKISELMEIGSTLKIRGQALENPAKFIREFSEENSCLVVLGSIYILGEILGKLEHTI